MEERKGGGTILKEVGQELKEENGDDMGEGKKGRWVRGMRRVREVGQRHEVSKGVGQRHEERKGGGTEA